MPARARRSFRPRESRGSQVAHENARFRAALENRSKVGGPETDLHPAWGEIGAQPANGGFPQGWAGFPQGAARAAVCRGGDGRGWCVAFEIPAAGGAQRRELPGSFTTLAAAMAAAYSAAMAQGIPLDGIGWG